MVETNVFAKAAVDRKSFNDNERSFVAWASREVLDRDNEIILASAFDLKNYRKNPVVLWAHDYLGKPVGKALWVKRTEGGLKFKPMFADTPEGRETYDLYKAGVMNTFSVGFIPRKWESPDDTKDGEFDWEIKGKRPDRVYTDVELLEISCVAVPANPEARVDETYSALVEAYEAGMIKTKMIADYVKELKPEIKRVIPYRDLGTADINTEWDAAAEVRAADVDDLKLMCAWYDAENADNKGAYKLPHHKASGGHPAVWRGVSAAMGALLGARGGVDIPDSDRRGVYNHLAKHYAQFDKEPPEFREISEMEELSDTTETQYEPYRTTTGTVYGGWESDEDADTALAQKDSAESENADELMIEVTEEELDVLAQTLVDADSDKKKLELIKALMEEVAELKAELKVLRGGIG